MALAIDRINDLANALKPAFLPGEQMVIVRLILLMVQVLVEAETVTFAVACELAPRLSVSVAVTV